MRIGDQQLGTPQAIYKGTQAAIEALTGVPEGAVAYATDLNQLGSYDGATWTWGGGGGGVESVTGDGVDVTDPLNPVISFPTTGDIGAESSANKAITMSGNTTSNIVYLTAKAIYDWAIAQFSATGHSHSGLVTNGDAHDHVGGDGASLAEGMSVATLAAVNSTTPADGDWFPNFLAGSPFTLYKTTWSQIKSNMFKFLAGQSYTAVTTGGTSTAFTLTTAFGSAWAQAAGQRFRVLFHTTAGASPTLNRDTRGAGNLVYFDSNGVRTACGPATIISGMMADVEFDGTDWVVLDPLMPTVPTDITPKDGWIADTNTWSFSSADSPTGVISINADMTALLYEKSRISITQTQALTAYFSMDSNSTSTVGSFTSTDTAMSYTSGKFSNAATFNGTTSKIVITDTALMKPTGEFTIGCWFKTSNAGAAKTLFQSYSANTAIAGFDVRVTAANVLSATIGKNTGTTLGVDYSATTGTTTVTDGNWHYVVFTFRNNLLQIYLDGNLETSAYSIAPAYAGTNYVRIGCSNGSGSDNAFFNGQIDDLFFINGYALDEATIHAKYLANTAQGTSDLSLEKFGLVSQVGAYSGGATLVTAYFGTDYMLTNAAISNPKYSNTYSPARFSTKESKWSVLVTSAIDHGKTTPTSSAYYGGSLLTPAGPSITIPIGAWWLAYKSLLGSTYTVAAVGAFGMRAALSTANNTQSDSDLSVLQTIVTPIVTSGAFRFTAQVQKPLPVILKVKTTFYLNLFQGSANTGDVASFLGSILPTVIRATSALL